MCKACDREEVRSMGLCNKCYVRKWRTGSTNAPRNVPLADEQRGRIFGLWISGFSERKIEKEVGVNRYQIRKVLA